MQSNNITTYTTEKNETHATTANVKKYSRADWACYQDDLYIHKKLMELGIVAVVAEGEKTSLDTVDEHHIYIDDQIKEAETYIATPEIPTALSFSFSYTELTAELTTPLTESSKSNNETEDSHQKCTNLLAKLKAFVNSNSQNILRTCVRNDFHFQIENPYSKNEVFLPMSIIQTGYYLYPWLSIENADWNFTGFDQFVTTAYLFGSSLRGRDNSQRLTSIFAYGGDFYPGQYITSILASSDKPSPYEEAFFIELEKWCNIFANLSIKHKQKKLLIHIPCDECVLSAITFYLRGHITRKALDDLFKIIFSVNEFYTQRINNICSFRGVQVITISPFDNLLGCITDRSDLATTILKMLQLFDFNIANKMTEEQQQRNEKEYVQRCLKKLLIHDYNIAQRQLWLVIIKALCNIDAAVINPEEVINIASEKMKTFDDLIKVANSIVISIASSGKPAYKICSILPASQKHIQENYSQSSKKSSLAVICPPVFNATILNSLLTYPGGTNKRFFYSAPEATVLSDLILNKRLLMHATKNIYLMLCGNTPQSAEIVLNYKKLTRASSAQQVSPKENFRFFKTNISKRAATPFISPQESPAGEYNLLPPPSPPLPSDNSTNLAML